MKQFFRALSAFVQTAPVVLWHIGGMQIFRPLDPLSLSNSQLSDLLDWPLERLNAYQWQSIDQGTTNRWRLMLPEAEMSRLFAKSNPSDFSTRLFGAMFQLGINEIAFYRDIQPQLDVTSPLCAGLMGNRYRYLILLEDLSIRNASFTDVSSSCDLKMAQSVIDTLASLHGACWQDVRLENEWRWVNRQQYRRNNAFLSFLRHYCSVVAIKRYGDLLPDETVQLAERLNRYYPKLEKCWGQGERTLVHGDAHIGNMYFLPSGETGLLDWQVLGYEHGMRDVSYFMINSLPTELRQAHQEQLIDRYIERLAEQGVALYRELALSQYRLHAPYAWVAAAVTAASDTMQDKKIAAAGLIRASKALVDLDVEKVLG